MKSFCFPLQLISHYIFQFHCVSTAEKAACSQIKETFIFSDTVIVDVMIPDEKDVPD